MRCHEITRICHTPYSTAMVPFTTFRIFTHPSDYSPDLETLCEGLHYLWPVLFSFTPLSHYEQPQMSPRPTRCNFIFTELKQYIFCDILHPPIFLAGCPLDVADIVILLPKVLLYP